ncbi:hypothetical protein G6F23_015909 [Rhizopus arrhizus]|nr:hypothetical protein G6F23_015909 [Rhizopus arrhizus]
MWRRVGWAGSAATTGAVAAMPIRLARPKAVRFIGRLLCGGKWAQDAERMAHEPAVKQHTICADSAQTDSVVSSHARLLFA